MSALGCGGLGWGIVGGREEALAAVWAHASGKH